MSIKKKLEIVINSINDFSKQTNMIAINASIYASRLSSLEGGPFQVLAREIQDMSARSIDKMEELDTLMNYISNLSILINKVGSQRMLLMKIVLGNTMNNSEISNQSIVLFELNLDEIEEAKINTPKTNEIIQSIRSLWQKDKHQMIGSDTEANFAKADKIVNKINDLIFHYEELSK